MQSESQFSYSRDVHKNLSKNSFIKSSTTILYNNYSIYIPLYRYFDMIFILMLLNIQLIIKYEFDMKNQLVVNTHKIYVMYLVSQNATAKVIMFYEGRLMQPLMN